MVTSLVSTKIPMPPPGSKEEGGRGGECSPVKLFTFGDFGDFQGNSKAIKGF